MTADRLILALCFMCVSSNDELNLVSSCDDSGLCETHTLSAPLGSSVLLPCNFSTRSPDWVSWVHIPEMNLVQLTSNGRVKFADPRYGRVKAFPNQGSEGNYSICIDKLKNSDLGCYRCEQGKVCLQVGLVAEIDSRKDSSARRPRPNDPSQEDEPTHASSCDDSGLCKKHTLSAPLGSSVLLPCNFLTRSLDWVSWVHLPQMNLVQLTSNGRVKFADPRYGRVKAFPNQGSEGNYSICIDELKNSDLGCYRCEQGKVCLQVELVAEIGRVSEEILLLVFICAGVAFILLIVGGYCCFKYILGYVTWTPDNMGNPVAAAGASAPPQETGRERQRGEDNLVYENDDQGRVNQWDHPSRNLSGVPGVQPHPDMTQPTQSGIYPNVDQFNFERMESHRRKQRFHRELFNRLRQASFSRHHYVNQSELSKQQAMSTQARNQRRGNVGKKRVEENHEYKNPIYNRSTEQLNNL